MTIENTDSFRGFEVYCDFYPSDQDYDFGRDEWNELIAEMKADGWRIIKDENGNWGHKCPYCVESGK